MGLLEQVAQELNTPVPMKPGSCNITSSYIMTHMQAALKENDGFFVERPVLEQSRLSSIMYKIPSYKMYEIAEQNPVLSEARGIVISNAGIRARPLPIFGSTAPDITPETIEYSVKVDGLMRLGVYASTKVLYLDKSGASVDIPHKGADQLVVDSYNCGLTPIFEEVPLYGRVGIIGEKPGLYLVGLRSVNTGRLLPYKYLIRLSQMYGLHSVLLLSVEVDIKAFLETSVVEGIVCIMTDSDNSQYLYRRKTRSYNKLQPVISYLRYGAHTSRFLDAASVDGFNPESYKHYLSDCEYELLNELLNIINTQTDTIHIIKKIKKTRKEFK